MKAGIIGFGSMGKAIFSRLSEQKLETVVFEKDPAKAKELKSTLKDLNENLDLDYIILAVKPKDINQLRDLKWKGTLISILAGVSTLKLKAIFPGYDIVRLMPNTPLQINEGISGVYLDSSLSAQREKILSFISLFTRAVAVEKEELIDAVTAVSGSGPAYVFMFIEALADAGVKCGLARKDALDLAVQTVLGSAKLVQQTGMHPAALKDQVTSPGGTTIEAIEILEENGFRNAIIKAVSAAFEKAKKLG